MGDFFLAMRKDIGLRNKGVDRNTFVHMILRNSDLFLEMSSENPNVTLDEVIARENEIGLGSD